MKEIECPACGEMIPDDSRYCDMCGTELLECINCGTLGTDQFCAECGKPMVTRKGVTGQSEPNRKTPPQAGSGTSPKPNPQSDINTTIGGRRKELVLKARRGNFILRPEDGAVIGRMKDTPYHHLLADCDLITRIHGKFVKRGRGWCIVDSGSTNGTLVNDVELEPDVPRPFAAGDVIDIGTYLFDVIER